MPTIALSPIPPIPSPGDKDFETKIGRVLSHMPTLATELKTIADATVEAATIVDVDGNATLAATAASQASLSANAAMSAGGTATTQANAAKAEATKAARSKSDAALAASQAGTNAQAAMAAAARAEDAVLAAEAIAAAKAEEVATQAAADAATQAVSGVIAQAQTAAEAAATSAADANTAKNAAQAAATTAGQSVAAIATHAQTAQTASTAASNHAHNAGLRAAESLASAQQATSAGQAATAGAAQVLEILDNLNTGPVVSVNGKYGAVNLVRGDLGLSNVDNTSDLAKPLSTAVQTALAGKSDTGHTHNDATTSAAGFMSAADKTKLDGVATNANNYTHPTGDGNLHVPATGTTNAGKVLTAGATAGSLSWVAPLALGSTAGTALGTAATGTATTAARSDHVHPLQSSVTGNAGTATKLQTARTINGVSFDGSANITINAVDSTAREPAITAGTTAQYWRGDKSWQALNKSAVGLGNVDNTSDASKPISTAVQTALDAKQSTLVSGSNIKTINGQILLGSGDIPIVRVSLDGPLEVFSLEVKTYTITDYSAFSTYAVSATAGTVSIAGNQITYTAPATAGAVTITVTRDGAASLFPLEIQEPPSYIATPAATPANFGDPFEGGFYAGMIWNQLTQSSTSKTLATGTQTFTVPSMTGAPIVYQGQTVEVRSRANPANKFVGTVTKAAGATLTINVTSIGGSGTFSDWSVMARHRIIVAPKASGENASVALKNANTAFPVACQTLTEGWTATTAMFAADTSTVYPAAHWARGLNIGGKTDWYIPARDELELLWRNLKPVTNDNYITANRAAANYTNNGSFGDTSTTHGTNKNSAPEGAAYTATTPGQTAATAFQSGGTEAFAFGSAYYWSSTEYSASSAWYQNWGSSSPGNQGGNFKTVAYRVRAVRRSII